MSHLPISSSIEVVLDTNVCVDLLNSPQTAGPRLGTPVAMLVPLIVFGELYFGAYRSQRVQVNVRRIEEFSKSVRLLEPNWVTANVFGQVRHKLITKGRTIPDDDMWIAALALQRNLPLVTRDQHFQNVDGLQIIAW